MGRRGLHDEGSRTLLERLAGKISVDLDTARRLFTLICALHWKGLSREVASGSRASARLPGRSRSLASRCCLPARQMRCARSWRRRSCAIWPASAPTWLRPACAPVRSDPFVAAVMDEIGIDVSQHTPNTIADLHDTSFDLIITLSPEAHHQALELTRTMAVDVEYWPTIDATVMLGQGTREQTLHALSRRARSACSSASRSVSRFEGGPTV